MAFMGALKGVRVVDLWASYAQNCALLADGELRCWGDDDSGQLGNGYGLHWSPAPPIVLGN